jgi:hypothetical protein
MAGKNQSTGKSSRERRLAAALRENVKRRKAQARARAIAQEAQDQAGVGGKHTPRDPRFRRNSKRQNGNLNGPR